MLQRSEPTSSFAGLRSRHLPGKRSQTATSFAGRRGPLSKKATPLAGEPQFGDIAFFRKRPTDGEVAAKWSAVFRIDGFDGKTAW
eukprot:171720-Pyramimonas_sp.AAC.1